MTKPRPKLRKSGFFISFEGGEGAGKSTQLKLLSEFLRKEGFSVATTRQPGGTALGQKIRHLLLEPEEKVSPRAELLLYVADRAQHVETLVAPKLAEGYIVLTDRYGDSSVVYQGICRGLGEKQVRGLNRYATAGLEPDVVFVLDVPLSISQQRLKSRESLDRIEQEKKQFHEKVRKGFLKIARQDKRRFVVLDGRKSPLELATEIQQECQRRLKRKKLWKTGKP